MGIVGRAGEPVYSTRELKHTYKMPWAFVGLRCGRYTTARRSTLTVVTEQPCVRFVEFVMVSSVARDDSASLQWRAFHFLC